jgi:glycosyltransferase involved in cell wall biosynthesis
MKKRILWSNEATFLGTGFSTYGLEVMKRLQATGKYELAELASYGGPHGSPKGPRGAIPWKYYHNEPSNEQEERIFRSKNTNQFGEWKFEHVCNDFKPHIVVNVRDWWMLEYECRSMYRPFFKHVIMPTVDAVPQNPRWLEDYAKADAVFSYTEWGLNVLKEEGAGYINTIASHPPGADTDVFKPSEDKNTLRKSMGLDPDAFIVGTVMRNQKRKLYPNLIKDFAGFLKMLRRNGEEELAQKSYLYLHTSYPDVGWDIPELIQEHKVGTKVILTYMCDNCKAVFPSFFRGAKAVCPRCNNPTAHMPNTASFVDRPTLAMIMNSFDCYVQYSNSEGFGMPMAEAAACGVPVLATDYSAMCDVIRKINGFPIDVLSLQKESETGCLRAFPDPESFIKTLYKLIKMSKDKRIELSKKAREGVLEHYTYERTAKMWEDFFDNLEIIPEEQSWTSPPRFHKANLNIPPNLTSAEFVRFCITEIWGMPINAFTSFARGLTKQIDYQQYIDGPQRGQRFSREDLVENMKQLNNILNQYEQMRTANNSPQIKSPTGNVEYSLA